MNKKEYFNGKEISDERLMIEKMLNSDFKVKDIARALGRDRNTIYKEIKRGLYEHITYIGAYARIEKKYASETAHKKYRDNLAKKGFELKIKKDKKLKNFIEEKLLEDKYSPAAILMCIKNNKLKFDTEIKSVNTIYSYIRKGVFEKVTMLDLPHKRKKHSKKRVKIIKKSPQGKSIEQRPKDI